MKKRLLILFSCLIAGIWIIMALIYLTGYNGNSQNGFSRKFASNVITGQRSLNLNDNSWRLSGMDDNYVYLGNKAYPMRLLVVDLNNKRDTAYLDLNMNDTVKLFRGASVIVDSDYIYLNDGVKPFLSEGKLSEGRFSTKFNVPYFLEALPISSNSFILKVFDKDISQSTIVKFTADSVVKPRDKILVKQVDGLFCTDGKLLKVPNSNRIFYVYYYRNEFINIDTNLNVLYTGKTLDTVSQTKITVASIKSSNELMLSSPPLFVNMQCCVNEKYLFIHSALKADNEQKLALREAAVIDIYAIKDGKYLFSFYIPFFNGYKLTDFKVCGRTLVALFGKYVYTFKLNF